MSTPRFCKRVPLHITGKSSSRARAQIGDEIAATSTAARRLILWRDFRARSIFASREPEADVSRHQRELIIGV